MNTSKTGVGGTMIAVLMLGIMGCAAGNRSDSTRSQPRQSGEIALNPDGSADLDLGQDWDQSLRGPGRLPGQPASGRGTTTPPVGSTADHWGIVLFTFTGVNHLQTATEGAQQIRQMGPQFATARAETRDSGSMIVLGMFTSRDDPAARDQLDRVRRMVASDGRRLFPRVMLTRIEGPVARLAPLDLRRARLARPGVRILYTLDVAVWSTFDDERVDYAPLKQQAEAYASQLRGQGYEAYFYHNNTSQVSIVTIGVFNSQVYDSQSGIYSDEVVQLLAKFPVRLNNGEPLLVPIDRFHPNRGTRPQAPLLVELP